MRGNSMTLITLASVLVLAGCKDNSVGVVDAVSGSYSLTSISGFQLPVVINDTVSISGGALALHTDGTFSESLDYTITGAAGTTTPTITCTGSVGQRGSNFDFAETATSDRTCGGNFGGIWDGADTFSVAFNPSFVAVYNRTPTQP
ncbi:MAG TPA: hypothetical protein VHL32_02320 [Gemmatimonadaceae bacterium]|jgi:hypothetical protein|nr:hypothetical protein [Gemmatimonadaceae bacterium]